MLGGQSVLVVVGDYRFPADLRGDWTSACTALLRNLRRNQVAQATEPTGAYGEFNYLGGTLVGCINLGGATLDIGPCVDAELGRVTAKGVGASVGFPAHTTWFALGAGGYASIPLGARIHLPLHLDVLAPLIRSEYVFKDARGRVYQAPAVGIRLRVGIEVRF